MIQTVLPIIGGLLGLFRGNKKGIAAQAGVEVGVVDKVIGAVEYYATKDERYQKFVADQIENARAHDIATFDKTDRFSNRLRSTVRPFVTFSAVIWYIYARVNEIVFTSEDYAIVGGILAFWFGFRPFEKKR